MVVFLGSSLCTGERILNGVKAVYLGSRKEHCSRPPSLLHRELIYLALL